MTASEGGTAEGAVDLGLPDPDHHRAPARIGQKPYDPAEDREKLRGRIALILTALFVLLILVLLAAAVAGLLSDDRVEKLAGVLIAPVSGLLGAVVGFYYGEQSHARA